MIDFKKLVTDRIGELGVKESAKFFGVSTGTVSNWATGKTSPSIDAVQLVLPENFGIATVSAEPEDQELTMWDGKEVIILQPVYRTIHPDTHFTMFANYAKYGPDKLGLIQEKGTVIHEARNILVHKALKIESMKAVIFMDDDMIFPCGNASLFNDRYKAGVSLTSAGFNTISRLMSHSMDKEIVGALYFGRHEKGKAQCSKGFANESENSKLRAMKYNGLVPDEWVGTGCIRITRAALEKKQAAIDGGMWPELMPASLNRWYGFFTPTRVGVGEDVSFGRRCKEIGIQTYIDTSLICLHNGGCNFGPRNTHD